LKVCYWSIYTTKLEPILPKIADQWKPPRRRSLMLASQQKNFLFLFRRKNMAHIGAYKRKTEKTFLPVFASNKASGAAGLYFSLGRGGIPTTPLPPRPLLPLPLRPEQIPSGIK
jgi:hypothetical protein